MKRKLSFQFSMENILPLKTCLKIRHLRTGYLLSKKFLIEAYKNKSYWISFPLEKTT
jgi:hypothetical protein